MKYRPRIIDSKINDLLRISGGLLIEGCKWCGKTTTAKQHAKSIIEFQDPDHQPEYEGIKNTQPSLFLEGEKPRLFDEWQRYPVVWDSIRTDTDRTGLKGQYLLTGSAKPSEGSTMHTGTGRISRVVMRTMSLYESGDSDGAVSLRDIIDGKDIKSVNDTTVLDLARYIVRGGWPGTLDLPKRLQTEVSREYINSLIHEEVSWADQVERNHDKMRAVLQSLSRNISTPVSNTTIEQDTKKLFAGGVSRATVRDYLNTLRKLFVVYDIPATTLKLRSKSAIRTSPKKEFVDPSIATALLGINEKDLLADLNTFGFLFECMAMRDLIVYAQDTGENIYYYRDADGVEIDAVLHTNDGRWGAIEVKLGAGDIDTAAANLLSFKDKVDASISGEPAFLMVLTGANYSYRREDGVYVVSISSLRD